MVFNGFGGNHHQLMFFVLCSDGGIVTIVNILEEVLVVIEMVVDQQIDRKVLIHKVYNIPPPGLYFGNGFNVRNPSDWRKKKENKLQKLEDAPRETWETGDTGLTGSTILRHEISNCLKF